MTAITCRNVDADNTILCGPSAPETLDARWFDASFWASGGRLIDQKQGRNAVHIFEEAGDTFVLRHYWRGGLAKKFVQDRYVFMGMQRTRMYRELDLLCQLSAMNLPICQPVGSRVTRVGTAYRGSLITRAIPGAMTLLEVLQQRALTYREISTVGETLAHFHARGIDHHDLNVTNILLDETGVPHLIDFDQGRIRQPNHCWQRANIKRLRRSLAKQVRLQPSLRWTEKHWQLLTDAYSATMRKLHDTQIGQPFCRL